MNRVCRIAIVLLAATAGAVLGYGAVPEIISYQGGLNDSSGTPVNANTGFTFRIYDIPSGGNALWTENQTIQVSNGVFHAQLGSVEPLPAYIFNQDEIYLGITVGADSEMTPRQRITSSAYSFRAEIGVAPIGSIVAWNKTMPGTPPLSDGWVECNGQTLSDPNSPYNGVSIPNLNGENRILKGDSGSGSVSTENFLPWHNHNFRSTGDMGRYPAATSTSWTWRNDMVAQLQSGTPQTFFHIVWVMRVR
mgnify:CR=1 FL=1